MTKPLRNAPIRTWQAGDFVQGFALLTKKELRQDRNGKSFLDLELVDASGSIAGKVWNDSPALNGTFEAHRFIAFRGSVKSYKDQLQIVLDDCREATEDDRRFGFEEALLVPSTPEDVHDLWRRLERLLEDEVERPVLRRLGRETLAAYGAALREHPAAKSMHHAYRGGLLEHVVSMAELAVAIAAHYRDLDRDLLLLGVLFHDLGKLQELGPMPVNDYTLTGRLVGHVVLGRDLLRERIAAIPGFPEDLQLLLEHMVLAHQGKKEFSSPVEPMTPEALALHFIDDLDSKLNQLRTSRTASPGVQYHRGLGRFVYLPAVVQSEESPDTGVVVTVESLPEPPSEPPAVALEEKIQVENPTGPPAVEITTEVAVEVIEPAEPRPDEGEEVPADEPRPLSLFE